MKVISLSVPRPFRLGPQFTEEGELVKGSWPSGLPYMGIRGWNNVGIPSKQGGLILCEFIADDDWPMDDLPGGWRAVDAARWDQQSKHQFNEDGIMTASAMIIDVPTDKDRYNSHQPDNEDGTDPVYERMAVILGWPDIDQANDFIDAGTT